MKLSIVWSLVLYIDVIMQYTGPEAERIIGSLPVACLKRFLNSLNLWQFLNFAVFF